MRLIKVDFELFIGFARKSKQPTWKLQIKLVLFSPTQESFCFCQVQSLAKSWKMEINITARVFSTLPKKKKKKRKHMWIPFHSTGLCHFCLPVFSVCV